MNNFIKQTHDQIKNLLPYQGGMNKSSLKQVDSQSIIKLASNENPLGISPLAKEAILKVLDQGNLYPEKMDETLAILSAHLNVETQQCILGNGSENIIAMLIQTFNRPENHIIIPQYGFSAYTINAKAHNANIKILKTPNLNLEVSDILNLANDKTAMIFIDNPGNPTGCYLTHSDIEFLLKNLAETTLLVLDEAYYEYAKTTVNYPNSLALQKKFPNLIILRTFSKIYGLAGLRIGYGIGHPSVIELLNKVRFPFNVSSLSLAGASAALRDKHFIDASLKVNNQGLLDFKTCFSAVKLDILPCIGNFITIDLKENSNAFFNFMLQQGIILRPLHAYQLPNHIRISIGTKQQNIRTIEKIYQYFGK